MIKKILSIISVLVILIVVVYYFIFYVFSGVNTPFAQACEKIQIGFTKEQVLTTMSWFENKQNVSFTTRDNNLSYVTPGLSGDYQCHIYLSQQNNVISVTRIFD